MFKRRHPKTPLQALRDFLWPGMGWGRALTYHKYKILRGGESTRRIAGGLALGVGISFTPFVGTHSVQMMILCFLFRLNLPAALVSSLIGNPWTFPFLFWISFEVGVILCTVAGMGEIIALPDHMSFAFVTQSPGAFFDYIFANPLKILLPLVIGGYTTGTLVWFTGSFLFMTPVDAARKAWHEERLKRVYKKAAKEEET